METDFLEELTTYVGFTAEHARALAALRPSLAPAFPAIVDSFYRAIQDNPHALAVFTGGRPQIERQKTFLAGWLEGVLSGCYDAEYLRLRARIGRTHVRIRLDQRYAIAGMNIVRAGLHQALRASDRPLDERPLAHDAIDKICDIELAIMLQTYAEDYTQRIRDNERLATLGQLAGFIGHELRNPLAVMDTSLHLMKKRLPGDDEKVVRHVQRLETQIGICTDIISSLLELARDRPLERTQVTLPALLASACEGAQLPPGVSLTVEVGDDLPAASVDEKQLRQVVVNLLSNASEALEHVAGDKRIVLRAEREGDALLLRVDDSGSGVADELQTRLFEPLVTTRKKGLGLGLALCRRIVDKHGGDIRVLHSSLGGARFELRFPGAFAGSA